MLYGNARPLPTLSKLREPRSFQAFIQATSQNAAALAKVAAKTFFPASYSRLGSTGINRMARATISKKLAKTSLNKDNLVPKKRSSLNGIKSDDSITKTTSAAAASSPVVASYPVYVYQPGYALTPYTYYGNTYQVADASKRSYFPYNFVYNFGQFGGKQTDQTSAFNTAQAQVDEKANPVNLVSKETDGFSEAVVDMKEALITKNIDGGVDMEEKYHDKRINSSKRNTVKKPKQGKDAIEAFKRVLQSRGSLENKLAQYLTNYVCGNDC